MTVTVRIPTQLRPLVGGANEIEVDADDVREAIEMVDKLHPGLKARVLDDNGSLRRFVNIFVADEDIRFLQGLDTSLADGGTVSIIPAVAGG